MRRYAKISPQFWIGADLEEKEYKIRKDAIVARIKLEEETTTDNPVVLEKLNEELEALADQHEAKLTEIHIKGVEERKKADDQIAKQEEKYQDQFVKGFTRAVDTMIFKARSLGDAMRTIFTQILESVVNMLAKLVAQWLLSHTILGEINAWFQAKMLAATAAANLARHAQQAASNVATVTGDAAVAAAGALAWWSDVNPIIAPAMAATQFALTEAYAPIASAAGGWDVPRDAIAEIHRDEMVLPAPLAQRVRDITTSGGRGADGSTSVAFHYSPVVHTIDASGLDQVLDKHSQVFTRKMVKWFRDGGINLGHAQR